LIPAVKGEKGLVELAVAKPFRILNPSVAKAPEGEIADDDHADDDKSSPASARGRKSASFQ
jgi:hypothetical protein